jgi:hypothetical protein
MDPAWGEYRRRRRMFLLAVLLLPLWLVPGATIHHVLAGYGYSAASLVTFLAVVVPPMACVMVACLRVMAWPCPGCGRFFHVRWYYGNVFARRCVHCGLPKWMTKQKPAEIDFP